MKQKQILKFQTWNVFSRQKLFHSRKDLSNFQKFYMKLLKKKFQVKFLKGFSGEMFNSVRFTHEIKSSECFFDRFHTHTQKKLINSPQIFFPLTWRKKKYLHFCCHSKLFSWTKKSFFHSVSHSRKQNSPENVFILDFTNRGIKFSHTWKKKNPLKILLIVFFYSVSHIKKFPWKQFQVEKTSKSEILENYTQD